MLLELEKVRSALVQVDPLGLIFADIQNVDEYDSEAKRIVEEARNMHTDDELVMLIHGIFVESFGADMAIDIGAFKEIANTILLR